MKAEVWPLIRWLTFNETNERLILGAFPLAAQEGVDLDIYLMTTRCGVRHMPDVHSARIGIAL